MRGMSFNLQKDRPAKSKLSELVYFMVQGGLDVIFLNEAYLDRHTVARAAAITGWEYYHPFAERGQAWNAVMWDPKKFKLIEKKCYQLTTLGYGKTPKRFATYVLLQSLVGPDEGERYGFFVIHLPPSIERKRAWLRTPLRWRLLVQSDKSQERIDRRFKSAHPHSHRAWIGDFNCTYNNRKSKYFPARWMGDHLKLKTIWSHPTAKAIHGSFGRRKIDDFRHSAYIVIERVFNMTSHEKTDHNPPIFDWKISKHLRRP